jgi:hypothetical protein
VFHSFCAHLLSINCCGFPHCFLWRTAGHLTPPITVNVKDTKGLTQAFCIFWCICLEEASDGMRPPRMVSKSVRFARDIAKIPRLVFDPEQSRTYYPSAARKSKPRILTEMLWWLVRNRDVPVYYYMWGLDRRGAKFRDVVPYRTLRRLRDIKNEHPRGVVGFDYFCVLRDKFVFSLIASASGIPVPRNIALCDPSSLTWLETMATVPLLDLARDPRRAFDGFCKRVSGTGGKGAFRLEVRQGRIYINGSERTAQEFAKRIDDRYIIQHRLQQHPRMSDLHSSSINTLRIMTYLHGNTAKLLCAGVRMGTEGRNVDNLSQGGILVGINTETGKLQEYGMHLPQFGTRRRQHPQSAIVFSEFQVPFFSESIESVLRFHRLLYGIHSIGWDVAVTPEGPVVLEGNDDWGGVVPTVLMPDFSEKFRQMHEAA